MNKDGVNFDTVRRMGVALLGVRESTAYGMPALKVGGKLLCTLPGTADDATPLHFTGKERDSETGEENGNDYFGARYYASVMGRFLTPDWAPKAKPVPYADLGDPQSLNLYNYVRNNPLSSIDPDGHDDCADHNTVTSQCYEAADNDTGQDGGGDGFLASKVVPASVNNGKVTYAPQTVTVSADPDSCNMSNFMCRLEYQAIMTWLAQRPRINAPNNGTPWYHNSCITSALLKGAGSTALDAVGLIPEGGVVAGAFSLWNGAAGISNGTKLLQGVKVGAAIVSTAYAGSDASGGSGAFSVAGAQAFTGVASVGASLARATPVVGQVLSGLAVAEDLYGTYKAVANCQ